MNVIEACIDQGVTKVVALSTDKASNPVNLYGATKLASDKLFIASNPFENQHKTTFSVVRYGNVMGSRGSVIPFFLSKYKDSNEPLPITDPRMTRFMITLDQAVELVWTAFSDMSGGEVYVKKIPSMNILKIAEAIAPDRKTNIIGIRPGEKIHEQMIGVEDAPHTFEYEGYYKILPAIHEISKNPVRIRSGLNVPESFSYDSGSNSNWMSVDDLRAWVKKSENGHT
jgi:FlaA1/EpsC-like NDP-sugar epimerase